jgi:hypothetical protein
MRGTFYVPGWYRHLSVFQPIYPSYLFLLVTLRLTSHLTPAPRQIPITLQIKIKIDAKIKIPQTTNTHLAPQAQKRVVPLASCQHPPSQTHRN